MEDIKNDNNQNLLFKIDNTRYQIQYELIFLIWAIILVIVLFFIVANNAIENGLVKSYFEFYKSQLGKGRFISMHILLFMSSIGMFYNHYKMRQKDNDIYFYNNGIVYKNMFLGKEYIEEIKLNKCCVFPRGNFLLFVFLFTIGGILMIPFVILEFIIFVVTKIFQTIKEKDTLNTIDKFIIVHSQKSPNLIIGYCYDTATQNKLIQYQKMLNIKGEK